MALSAQEEALVRQLLDRQAAILSLASNEATITSKLGATKVTLADLVAASLLADADLLLIRQGTNDKSVTAKKLADYIAAAGATKLRTPRTLTIGNTGKSFDGSAGVSWSLAEVVGNGVPGTAQELPGGVDLNTIKTPGFYVITLNDNAASGTNYPIAQAGSLVVLGNTGVAQLYYSYGGGEAPRAFFRTFYDYLNKWSPWREIYHTGNTTSLAALNGWVVLPGGVIIQWGRMNFVNPPNDFNSTAYFPMAFPNNIFQVSTTLYSYNGTLFDTAVAVTAHRLSGFDFTIQEWSIPIDQNVDVVYIAIGS